MSAASKYRHVDEIERLRAENARLREALAEIVKIGTREHTVQVGDMYDLEGGYDDYEVVSDEAEIARAALAGFCSTYVQENH